MPKQIPQMAEGKEADLDFVFFLGNVHGRLGGPARTIAGYVRGLSDLGLRVAVAGYGTPQDLAANFAGNGECALIAVEGNAWARFRRSWNLPNLEVPRGTTIIVGVWHMAFFSVGVGEIIRRLRRDRPSRISLVPTMSLTNYDWRKHRLLKRALRPLVGLILSRLHGVVFASSGELEESGPRRWVESTVILHPTLASDSEKPDYFASRDLDVVFAGRVDPQKDLGLLLRALSQSVTRPRLTIVGDGEPQYVASLKALALDLKIEDRITWAGWQTHDDVMLIMRRAKIVAVTSIVENFCHVAVETIIGGAELILVDRVMSARDFQKLASIQVCEATPESVGSAIDASMADWTPRGEARLVSAESVTRVCSTGTAGDSLLAFMGGRDHEAVA